jgi:hypothetical protein
VLALCNSPAFERVPEACSGVAFIDYLIVLV